MNSSFSTTLKYFPPIISKIKTASIFKTETFNQAKKNTKSTPSRSLPQNAEKPPPPPPPLPEVAEMHHLLGVDVLLDAGRVPDDPDLALFPARALVPGARVLLVVLHDDPELDVAPLVDAVHDILVKVLALAVTARSHRSPGVAPSAPPLFPLFTVFPRLPMYNMFKTTRERRTRLNTIFQRIRRKFPTPPRGCCPPPLALPTPSPGREFPKSARRPCRTRGVAAGAEQGRRYRLGLFPGDAREICA